MKDLEIRGAGNLLGAEQHGHVAAVGFHLYTRLLAEAVKRLQGRAADAAADRSRSTCRSRRTCPIDYVADDASARLSLYQRLAGVTDLDALGALTLELRDRFGPPPEPALNLLYLVQLKCLAARAGVESIAATDEEIIVQLRAAARFDSGADARTLPQPRDDPSGPDADCPPWPRPPLAGRPPADPRSRWGQATKQPQMTQTDADRHG